MRRVKANKGSAGVDGMTVGGITDYLKEHWPAMREQTVEMENGLVSPSVEGTPQEDDDDRSWSAGGIASFDMRMTVMSTFAANGRANG